MRIIKIFSTLAIVVLGCLISSQTAFAGSTLQLAPSQINIEAGQSFTLTAKIVSVDSKNYTVRFVMNFPPELVSVQTWKYTDDWMPIRKPDYDELDNTTGVFIRTAGFPEGFDSATTFGTVTFLAKKTGVAYIQLGAESLALDENNDNVATLGQPVTVTVTKKEVIAAPKPKPTSPVPEPEPEPEPVIDIPTPTVESQLFDIEMNINRSLLEEANDLISQVIFESPSTAPTLFNLEYKIIDSKGNEVYREQGEVTIETERLLTKEFNNLVLGEGKYTLVLTTIYNENVKDEFRQGFEIKAKVKEVLPVTDTEEKTPTKVFIVLIIAFIMISALVVYFLKSYRTRG